MDASAYRPHNGFRLPHPVIVTVLTAIFSIIIAAAAGYSYGKYTQTLIRNGRWISAKTGLKVGVMGAYSFVATTQALADGALNLGSWHGYQQVWYREPTTLTDLSFRFYLEPGAYVSALFGNPRTTYRYVRFSSTTEYPTADGQADASGRFLSRTEYPAVQVSSHTWHRVGLHLSPAGYDVTIDGTRLWHTAGPSTEAGQTIGFRGSLACALVDDIIGKNGNRTVFTERFGDIPSMGTAAIAVFGCLAVGYAAIFAVSAAVRRKHRAGTYCLVAATTLAISSLVIAAGMTRYVRRYPVQPFLWTWIGTPKDAGRFYTDAVASVSAAINRKLPDNEYRIAFIGSSQTQGAGASDESRTFVSQVGVELARRYPDRHIGTYDLAIDGTTACQLSKPYVDRWRKTLRPDVLVVNLSANDSSRATGISPFVGCLRQFIQEDTDPVMSVVFLLEANSPESDRSALDHYHAAIRDMAKSASVAVIDTDAFLAGHKNDGFLWWDKYHLTDFGQTLLAEKLEADLPDVLHW